MLIGYARVSTEDQNLDLQMDELKKVGCTEIFTDKQSGMKADRQGLTDALRYLREGDTLVVWRLDRLGRSLKDLIERVAELKVRKIEFRSLRENIDTNTSAGKLQFHIFSALAEFERDIIRERTMAGLAAARARGKLGGRKPSMDKKQLQIAATLMKDKSISIKEVCATLGISRATLYRHISPEGEIRV